MLTPDYIQGAPAELEELFLKLEEEVIRDICRRIEKVGSLSDTAEHQIIRLREMGAGTDYIKKKIAEYSKLSDEDIDRLFFDAAQTCDDFYAQAYAKANKDYTPYEYNDFFQQTVTAAVNQTKGELRNMTGSIGFSYVGSNGIRKFHTAAQTYHDCLDYAFTQVAYGMTDYTTAIRNATRRLTDSGLQFVDYESGAVAHADVAARRAVLTGLSQMTGKISEHNAAELDTDIVEVTAHAGARPDHAEWQGRWYSLSGKSKKYRSLVDATGYGTGAGLKGWNCRHDFYPVIDGISEPSYTEEELKNIDPPPFEYNGKTYTYYEATQRQRYMERTMRKTKRELLAADSTGDKDRFTERSVLLRRQREEYSKFSKAAGLLTQNERTQVYGFGHSEASRAAWAAKKAAQPPKGGNLAPVSPSSSGGHAVTVNVPTPPTNGGKGKLYRDEGLTRGGGSGTMNNKTTKLNTDGTFSPNPMDAQRYKTMKQKLKENGCPVIAAQNGSEEERYLKWLNAEAISDEHGIIHLGDVPSASAFFEEVIHFTQIQKYGAVESSDFIERAAREVAANRKLLRHGKSYGFNSDDFKDIENNLAMWEKDFEMRVGVSYDKANIKREI